MVYHTGIFCLEQQSDVKKNHSKIILQLEI